MIKSQSYIPSLDGLRTIAFLIVFLSHAGFGKIVPGGFGVTIFFFLSGYLITTLLRREYEKHREINLKHFYLRRILRIWPGFYVVLLVGTSLTLLGVLPGRIIVPAFLSQIFHYYNYYSTFVSTNGVTIGSGVYWSLAVEEHFYCLFPFLYLFLLKLRVSRKGQMWVFWLLCLVVLLWRCVLVFGMGAKEGRIFHLSDTRIDSILFGCALAVGGNPVLDAYYGSERVWKWCFLPAGTVLLLCSFLFRSPQFRDTFRFTVQGIGLYAVFVTAIRFSDWTVFRFLNWRATRFVGLLSYSLYLVHDTVIQSIDFYLPQMFTPARALISLIISFIFAYVMYRCIELPCGRLRKQLSAN